MRTGACPKILGCMVSAPAGGGRGGQHETAAGSGVMNQLFCRKSKLWRTHFLLALAVFLGYFRGCFWYWKCAGGGRRVGATCGCGRVRG